MFTVQETAARREAEQLRVSQSRSTETRSITEAEQLDVSQSRSTETVEVTAASWEADRLRTSHARAEEMAGEAAARREEDQHQTAAARDGERLPVDKDRTGTVRDFLLTMWVLSPTIVVIFVQCIDCSSWAFCVMGCCPQISPCLHHLRLDYERIFILS